MAHVGKEGKLLTGGKSNGNEGDQMLIAQQRCKWQIVDTVGKEGDQLLIAQQGCLQAVLCLHLGPLTNLVVSIVRMRMMIMIMIIIMIITGR